MAKGTAIEWTDETWNPVAGCSVVSPGCTNCYAMRRAHRLSKTKIGARKYSGLTRKSGGRAVWTGKVRCIEAELDKPRKWRKPRRVFVNSMSDLFHESVPASFVRKVWEVMADTPRHTYQILTKRPDRMAEVTSALPVLENVWLGTSVESDEYLDRIDQLRKVQASVRFVSFEPLLGSVAAADLTDIHWAIAGGESGPGARPMQGEWVREVRDRCVAASVAFFFKQWGGVRPKSGGRELDGQEWSEYPEARGWQDKSRKVRPVDPPAFSTTRETL